jgi:uncharacterized tellurite resistance protein B-like protein/succinate dehydrogenase hydrophobic anchor subunit
MNPYYFSVSIINFFSKSRRTLTFVLVAIFILAADALFFRLYNPIIDTLNSRFGIALNHHQLVSLDFAPEIWAGVLAMVLGTLIIVIAIAAESTPRLIDLYLKDWTSLFFIWFIVLASLHAFVIMFYGKPMNRNSSVILNTYGFLTLSYVLALPYIFYILIYSKTSNVVTTISTMIMKDIYRMTGKTIHGAMGKKVIVEEYQQKLLESLDQLDDLLSFVEFKETQSDIIRQIGRISNYYIAEKGRFNGNFFKLTKVITRNATYRTYTEQQYLEMQDNACFFEVKIFRSLGNSYIKMLENDRYDIASLIPAELVDIGTTCIKVDNPAVQNHINIRFNTLFRFAIKHANRNNEPRNLYNLAFHYSNMIQAYIKAEKVIETKVCYDRIKFYGNEIYKSALNNPSLYFIVDTLTFELKKCQILVKELDWSKEDQLHLLKIVLDLDQPPNFSKDDIDKTMLGGNNGTRRIQIGLALYYLSQGMNDFAETIVEDYLDDLNFFDEKEFRTIVDGQCFLLSIFGPTFWEDTDRGNINIYFAPEKDQIATFKEMINEQIKKRLRKLEADTQYLSMEVEALLNKRHIQDGFLNDADSAKLENLQGKISIRKTSQIDAIGWTGENDLIYSLVSIAFSDRDIDESEKGVILETFKSMLPNIDDDHFNILFIPTVQLYTKLKTPEEQTKQFTLSLKALIKFFVNDRNKLRRLLSKYVELTNADSFVHENEVKLIKTAARIWKISGKIGKGSDGKLIIRLD